MTKKNTLTLQRRSLQRQMRRRMRSCQRRGRNLTQTPKLTPKRWRNSRSRTKCWRARYSNYSIWDPVIRKCLSTPHFSILVLEIQQHVLLGRLLKTANWRGRWKRDEVGGMAWTYPLCKTNYLFHDECTIYIRVHSNKSRFPQFLDHRSVFCPERERRSRWETCWEEDWMEGVNPNRPPITPQS